MCRRFSKETDLEEGKVQGSECLPELKTGKVETSVTTTIIDEKSISDMSPVGPDCV